MSFKLPTYYVLKRRIVKSILRIMGWQFRGQIPPATWPQLIFVSPAEGKLKSSQKLWVKHLTATPSIFLQDDLDIEEVENALSKCNTALVSWNLVEGDEEFIKKLFDIVRENDGRISACAWDVAHKAIKFHSLFKPSDYLDRDLKYLSRFFVYFKRV